MMHTLSRARRALAITAIAGVATLGVAAGANAGTTSTTYDLQASAAGQTATFTVNASVTDTAPTSVTHSTAFTIKLSIGSVTIPTSAGGYSVKDIQGIAIKVPVPTNSTYKSGSLSGGTGFGPGTPTVSQASRIVTIKVPGPINAGTTVTFPTLTMHLVAGATAGKVISEKLYGTSYTTPGITFTAVITVVGLPVNASVVGYPNPNPVLSKTTIK